MNADKTWINADKIGVFRPWVARARFSPRLTGTRSLDRRQPTLPISSARPIEVAQRPSTESQKFQFTSQRDSSRNGPSLIRVHQRPWVS